MAITATGRGTSGAEVGAGGTGTNNLTPSGNCAAGSLLVAVYIYRNSGGGGADGFTSFTDTKSNTWTTQFTLKYDPAGADAGFMLRVLTTTQDGGTLTTGDTVTGQYNWNSGNGSVILLTELASNAGGTIGFLTGAIAASATSSASPTITSGTITVGDAIVGFGGSRLGTGTWSNDADTSNGSWVAAQQATFSAVYNAISQAKVVTGTATQTYNPTLSVANFQGLGWVSAHETPAATANPRRTTQIPQLLAQ